jgi:hypothetical protein
LIWIKYSQYPTIWNFLSENLCYSSVSCIEHWTHLRAEILMLHRFSTVNSWRTTISIYSSTPSRTHFSDLVMHVTSNLNWMGTRYHLAQYNLLWNSTELPLNLVLCVWTFTSKAKWRRKTKITTNSKIEQLIENFPVFNIHQ